MTFTIRTGGEPPEATRRRKYDPIYAAIRKAKNGKWVQVDLKDIDAARRLQIMLAIAGSRKVIPRVTTRRADNRLWIQKLPSRKR